MRHRLVLEDVLHDLVHVALALVGIPPHGKVCDKIREGLSMHVAPLAGSRSPHVTTREAQACLNFRPSLSLAG